MSRRLFVFAILCAVSQSFAGPAGPLPVEDLTSAIKQVTQAMDALSGGSSTGSGEVSPPVHAHIELPKVDGIPDVWSPEQMKMKGTGPNGEGTCCYELKAVCDGDKPGIYYDSTYRDSDKSVDECMARAPAAEEECHWSKEQVAASLILRWGPKNFADAHQAEGYCQQEVFKS